MKKFLKILKYLIFILPIGASIYGSYLLLTYPYLSDQITYAIIAAICILSLLFLFLGILTDRKKKKKLSILMICLCLALTGGVSYLDILYSKLNDKIDNITDSTEYEYSYVYVLDSFEGTELADLNRKTIGLKPETDELGYILPVQTFDELGIKYNVETYSNGTTAANALLTGAVDAIVVDNTDLTKIDELYSEFALTTKCIGEFKREVTDLNQADSVDTSTEPFTVLINGVDTREYDLSAGSRADVIMLATFNPQTMKLSLISIPRDTYVPVTCEGGVRDKITHSGNYGVNCTISSLEEYFDIDINYYVKLNFQAVVGLVEAVGGIDVTVPITFCEQDSNDIPDAICLDEGYQHLNGEQALALARHRKTLANGDIGRGLNQQIVINGLIDKLASGKIVTSVNELLEVVGDNVQTNMPKSDMMKLFSLLTSIGSQSLYSNTSSLQVTSSTLQGEGAYLYADWAGANIYYYVPYVEAKEAVKTEIRKVLGTETYEWPTDFSFDANKPFDAYDQSNVNVLSGYTLDVDTSSGQAEAGSQS